MDHLAYWAKAEESLATAEDCFEQERYNSCANRCYYAMFQSAVAVLSKLGSVPTGTWTHKYVGASVGGYLIKQRKLLPGKFAALYWKVEEFRHKADYQSMNVTKRNASLALRTAREFVSKFEEVVKE